MAARVTFTTVFEAVPEGGYSAYIEEIPGMNAQEGSLGEDRRNLREALGLVLDVRRELAEEKQAGRSVICETIQLAAL